jgi:AraC-like DNA-binding protein
MSRPPIDTRSATYYTDAMTPTEYTLDDVMALLQAERQRYPSMRAMARAWGVSPETVSRIFRTGTVGDGSIALEVLGLRRVTDSTTRYLPK